MGLCLDHGNYYIGATLATLTTAYKMGYHLDKGEWVYNIGWDSSLKYNNIDRMQDRPNEEFRQRREKFANEIRRQNREELLAKRRNLAAQESSTEPSTNSSEHIIDARFADKVREFHALPATRDQFMAYLAAVHSPDMVQQHLGVIQVRKLLIASNPPIQQVIDAGLIPKLITYAKQTDYPQLQLESVWCLTNVAAGNTKQTATIIDKNGIRIFVDLLLSEHMGIVEQAVWALGNVASDSPNYRDMIVKSGGLTNLISVIEMSIKELPRAPGLKQIIQSAVWSLAAICRTRPLPNYLAIKQAMVVFFYVVQHKLLSDQTILANVCWAISYYTDKRKEGPGKIDKIQACIDSGVLPTIIEQIGSSYDSLVVTSLKIVGNIATGTKQQAYYLISLGALAKLESMLHESKKIYRKQACWALSNITASSLREIEAVFSNRNMVGKLMSMLQTDLPDVRTQICYIFSNATDEGDLAQLAQFFTEIGLLKAVCEILRNSSDVEQIFAALECIEAVLFVGSEIGGKQSNQFTKELHRLKIVPKLEELQHHEEDKIYEQVSKIVTKYFEVEDPLKL